MSVRASAPGRVNLIGEHTDYNDGLVLPMPIPQQTHVELTLRSDLTVSLTSESEPDEVTYQLGQEQRRGGWVDYAQGVTRALADSGHRITGFAARVSSEVPIGAGLSSSAALEIALLRALRQAFSLPLDDHTLALLGQRAEVELVGVPTGLMDQLASSLGVQGSALFIDIRSGDTRTVELPGELELVVIASGVTHAHGTGDYRQRRSECERAAEALGVHSLRDVSLAQLDESTQLDPLLLRRARHVVSENERVLQTVQALADADLAALRKLFADSHRSMRDDYEVSVPEIDLLVSLAEQTRGIVGARLTGGGFGGSVVMLAKRGEAHAAAQDIARRYAEQTQRTPTILLPQP